MRAHHFHFRTLILSVMAAGLVASPILLGPIESASPLADEEINLLLRDTLNRTILDRRVVTFSYRGHLRTVEPHACGVSSKAGPVLHGYQIAGSSASEPPPGWRTFALAEIQDLRISEETFPGRRDGYSSEDLKLDPLWAELPPPVTKADE